MPLVRTAMMATAALLIGSVAYAQPTDTTPSADQAPPPSSAPADTASAAAASGSTVDASTGAQVIASQPVPDTPANRAAYGQPLSRAGKRTAPRGN